MHLTRAAFIPAIIISTFSVPEQTADISRVLAGGTIADVVALAGNITS